MKTLWREYCLSRALRWAAEARAHREEVLLVQSLDMVKQTIAYQEWLAGRYARALDKQKRWMERMTR